MIYTSIYKVPNGKLLKIKLECGEDSSEILSIQIAGDFFAYPEEAIEIMEDRLKNTVLKKEDLLETINAVIKENDIEFIGLDAEGLTTGILMCLS